LNFDIPCEVTEVLENLRSAGGQPLLVGGVVRDTWLGRTSTDYDIATTLLPAQLAELFTGVNLAFGSVRIRLGVADVTVTTLREDGEYLDQRHPSTVVFVLTPEQDSTRRDFTVNAIYADPFTGAIFDPQGGVEDLERGVIRMVGSPQERLREDPLRILRAVRFAARLGSRFDPATESALRDLAAETSALSRERVFEELTDAFTGVGRGTALRLFMELGITQHVLPELVAMPGVEQPPEFHPEGDVFVHTCLVLDHATEGDPVQAWAAVLHDVGKPATFERAADRIRFSGHDALSAEMTDGILRRFNAPNDLRETVVDVVRGHIRFASIPQMKPRKRETWMRSANFAAHLEFHRADCAGSHGKLGIYESARAEWRALPPEPPPPLCTGADVLALGVTEGPVVGEVLRRLHQQCDADDVSDRDAALTMLRAIVESRFRGLA